MKTEITKYRCKSGKKKGHTRFTKAISKDSNDFFAYISAFEIQWDVDLFMFIYAFFICMNYCTKIKNKIKHEFNCTQEIQSLSRRRVSENILKHHDIDRFKSDRNKLVSIINKDVPFRPTFV